MASQQTGQEFPTLMANSSISFRTASILESMSSTSSSLISSLAATTSPLPSSSLSSQNEMSNNNNDLPLETKTGPKTTNCPVNHCLTSSRTAKYPNIIIAPRHTAGLGDRLDIMHALADLAGMVCARLVVLPPHAWLDDKHNDRQPIPTNLTWSDLVSFPFLAENVTTNSRGNSTLVNRILLDPVLQEDGPELPGFRYEKFKTARILDMLNVVRAQKEEGSKGAFVWFMKFRFFWAVTHVVKTQLATLRNVSLPDGRRDRHMLPRFFESGPGCGHYVHQEHPTVLKEIAQQVLQQAMTITASSPPPPFGYLHIRRGDGMKECDATIDKLTSFLTCSFSGPNAREYLQQHGVDSKPNEQNSAPFLMFMASDANDPTYRQRVLQLLNQQGGSHRIRAMDLDKLILETVQSLVDAGTIPPHYTNNFTIFLIGRILLEQSTFHIRQRRFICPAAVKRLWKTPWDPSWARRHHQNDWIPTPIPWNR